MDTELEEQTQLHVWLPTYLHRLVKTEAAQLGVSMTELVTAAIVRYFDILHDKDGKNENANI